ncbi:hypothetical protein [Amycolatopsis sp. NPDC059021]|uniref:hypothetical protein n=1 Tax=Amycolatopsis sp. NPDC059021 TaxID=3346704 RepID=UPI003671CCD3
MSVQEVITVTSAVTIRSGLYRGTLPAIFLDDDTGELVLVAGPRLQDAKLTKE